MLQISRMPEVRAEMLIRKPVREVFEAFVDPDITTQFWFTKSSGRLEQGKRVRWDWEMYGAWDELLVEELVPEKMIRVIWSDGSRTEWQFSPRGEDAALVSIVTRDLPGEDGDLVAAALDQMGGYTIVLCGLKAWLEHGIRLNAVADKSPDAIVQDYMREGKAQS